MSPYELYRKYRNLSVGLHDGTTVSVDIHKYRENGAENPQHDTVAGKMAFSKLKEKIVQYYEPARTGGFVLNKKPGNNHVLELTDDGGKNCPLFPKIERVQLSPDLLGVFLGKGSPDEICQALRLAVFFGLTLKENVQGYCDANLGIDCSGFASNVYDMNAADRLNSRNAAYFLNNW